MVMKEGHFGPASELLTSSQLVEKTHESLKIFFGKEVKVAAPSSLFLGFGRISEAEGFSIFSPIYFANEEFTQESNYPGWKIKPEKYFWEQIKEEMLPENARRLPGAWAYIDASIRPNYDRGKQLFENDPLAPILQKGRSQGKIEVPDLLKHVPETSRFGASPKEHDTYVFPELSKIFSKTPQVKEAFARGLIKIRKPTATEFNFAGNLYFPHFDNANTSECLDDKVGRGGRRLFGGRKDEGGLAHVSDVWYEGHDDRRAFRPLIVFAPKS